MRLAEVLDRVLYHGTGTTFDKFRGMTWASERPELASDYADMRSSQNNEEGGNVIPVRMNITNPFNADVLPKTVTIKSFTDALCGPNPAPEVKELIDQIRQSARREESGPYYNCHDFWYDPVSLFGNDGAAAIQQLFMMHGYDGVKFTERGHLTYGAFNPDQVSFALSERRSHPELNLIKTSAIDTLAQYKDRDDIYITFTALPKVGINPKSKYETPNGIYTYPLKKAWIYYDIDKNGIDGFPFASQQPYINILQSNNVQDILSIGQPVLDRMISYMKSHRYTDDKIDDIQKSCRGRQYIGGKVWGLTYYASRNPNHWNILLRKLGFRGILDTKGIIHKNEKVQCLFLDVSDFKVIDRIINKNVILEPKQEMIQSQQKTFDELSTTDQIDFLVAGNNIHGKLDATSAVMHAVVKKNPLSIQWMRRPPENIQLLAVKKDYHAIQHIRNPSSVVIHEAIHKDGKAIQYIRNPTVSQCEYAVRRDSMALKYITQARLEITPMMKETALRDNGLLIRYIKQPSPELIKIAAQENGSCIQYLDIDKLSDEILIEACKSHHYTVAIIPPSRLTDDMIAAWATYAPDIWRTWEAWYISGRSEEGKRQHSKNYDHNMTELRERLNGNVSFWARIVREYPTKKPYHHSTYYSNVSGYNVMVACVGTPFPVPIQKAFVTTAPSPYPLADMLTGASAQPDLTDADTIDLAWKRLALFYRDDPWDNSQTRLPEIPEKYLKSKSLFDDLVVVDASWSRKKKVKS